MTMWTVKFSSRADKQFGKLDKVTQKKIEKFLRHKVSVQSDPRVFAKPLMGPLKSFWRFRVGDYRLICDIQDETIVIEVLKIGHRRDVYER